jgi:hypothetical protein
MCPRWSTSGASTARQGQQPRVGDVGGVLVGLLAMHRRDPVFILLQVSSLTSAAVILFLARRYRGMVCATHTHLVPARRAAMADR